MFIEYNSIDNKIEFGIKEILSNLFNKEATYTFWFGI